MPPHRKSIGSNPCSKRGIAPAKRAKDAEKENNDEDKEKDEDEGDEDEDEDQEDSFEQPVVKAEKAAVAVPASEDVG